MRIASSQSFASRLATARQLIANAHVWGLAPDVLDQVGVASEEARGQVALIGFALRTAQPHRGWRNPPGRATSSEARAYVLAALLDCLGAPCPHLRATSLPQPVYARLPLRRLDCRRCLATLRRPPAKDADRCDMCGSRGVAWFVPFVVQSGPTLISGDVCSLCSAVLEIDDPAREAVG